MNSSISVLGEPHVGAELLAAADVRAVRALTGNPEDTRVIAKFSWHRSVADVRDGTASSPSLEDGTAWAPIPGAMRPTYRCSEGDIGHWLRVTVMPLLAAGAAVTSTTAAAADGRGATAGASAVGQTNRPLLRALAGPIRHPPSQRDPPETQPLAQLQQQQQQQKLPRVQPQAHTSPRVVAVDEEYTAVAEGGDRRLVPLSPRRPLADEGLQQTLLQQQQHQHPQQQPDSGSHQRAGGPSILAPSQERPAHVSAEQRPAAAAVRPYDMLDGRLDAWPINGMAPREQQQQPTRPLSPAEPRPQEVPPQSHLQPRPQPPGQPQPRPSHGRELSAGLHQEHPNTTSSAPSSPHGGRDRLPFQGALQQPKALPPQRRYYVAEPSSPPGAPGRGAGGGGGSLLEPQGAAQQHARCPALHSILHDEGEDCSQERWGPRRHSAPHIIPTAATTFATTMTTTTLPDALPRQGSPSPPRGVPRGEQQSRVTAGAAAVPARSQQTEPPNNDLDEFIQFAQAAAGEGDPWLDGGAIRDGGGARTATAFLQQRWNDHFPPDGEALPGLGPASRAPHGASFPPPYQATWRPQPQQPQPPQQQLTAHPTVAQGQHLHGVVYGAAAEDSDLDAYLDRADAREPSRRASPVPPQRLDRAFQAVQVASPDDVGGGTGGSVRAASQGLRERLAGWAGWTGASGGAGAGGAGHGGQSSGGGSGSTLGSGSLQEALEQLLAQHQEVIQQAAQVTLDIPPEVQAPLLSAAATSSAAFLEPNTAGGRHSHPLRPSNSAPVPAHMDLPPPHPKHQEQQHQPRPGGTYIAAGWGSAKASHSSDTSSLSLSYSLPPGGQRWGRDGGSQQYGQGPATDPEQVLDLDPGPPRRGSAPVIGSLLPEAPPGHIQMRGGSATYLPSAGTARASGVRVSGSWPRDQADSRRSGGLAEGGLDLDGDYYLAQLLRQAQQLEAEAAAESPAAAEFPAAGRRLNTGYEIATAAAATAQGHLGGGDRSGAAAVPAHDHGGLARRVQLPVDRRTGDATGGAVLPVSAPQSAPRPRPQSAEAGRWPTGGETARHPEVQPVVVPYTLSPMAAGSGVDGRVGPGADDWEGAAEEEESRTVLLRGPSPSASTPAAGASLSSSTNLQDMRSMNEALMRQLAESTRLQMQMQKALDAAMEQLLSLHAKEHYQEQQRRRSAQQQTSPVHPPASSPQRSSPLGAESNQSVVAGARRPSPPAPSSPSAASPRPRADGEGKGGRAGKWQHLHEGGMDSTGSAPLTAAAAAAAASPTFGAPPARTAVAPGIAGGAGLGHQPPGGAGAATSPARSPGRGAVHSPPPQYLRGPGIAAAAGAAVSVAGSASWSLSNRKATAFEGSPIVGAPAPAVVDPGLGAAAAAFSGPAASGSGLGAVPGGGAGADAAGGVAAGVRAPGSTGQEANTVEALRSLLHQHHMRWRVKKAKLKEQAQAWQYTAWRYATAWKKARAMLQAMTAAPDGAAPAAAVAADVNPAQHHAPPSPPPHQATAGQPPGNFRPLVPGRATAPSATGATAPPAAGQRAPFAPAAPRAAPGAVAAAAELRRLSSPGVAAGIAAALQRREPTDGGLHPYPHQHIPHQQQLPPAPAGRPVSPPPDVAAYLMRSRRTLPNAAAATSRAQDLAAYAGAVASGGAATAGMKGTAPHREVRGSPLKLRSRAHRKRGSTAASGPGGGGAVGAEGPGERVFEVSFAPRSRAPQPDAAVDVGSPLAAHSKQHPWGDAGAGAAPGNDTGPDLGRLRDQGSRGRSRSAGRGREGAPADMTAGGPEPIEVAAHWPATLRSGCVDGARSRSPSPTLGKPPWRTAGRASCTSPGLRQARNRHDISMSGQPELLGFDWPDFPPEPPHPFQQIKPPSIPYRDPEGWWHYPEGWLEIYQKRPPHMLTQQANGRAHQRHHHRYPDSHGDTATNEMATSLQAA